MTWVAFGRRWLPITLMVLLGALLCVRLGIWQLDRLAQRRQANARIVEIQLLPAVQLPSEEHLAEQEFRAVLAQGTYDFVHQVALRNQFHNGEYGFHILTPLLLDGVQGEATGGAILVDRGWIPAGGNERPDDWGKYDVPGVVRVTGVVRRGAQLRTPGAAGALVGTSLGSADRFALVVDTAEIGLRMGYDLPPYYLQAGGGNPETLPAVEVVSLDLTEGPHLGYAIQWFFFSIILLAGYARYVQRQEQANP